MKPDSERYSLSVRLPPETIKRIEKSGEVPSDWLRQAVQVRLESEQQATTTVNTVEKQIESLQQNGTDIRREIVKLQQSEAITQATLADLRKTLAEIQRIQATFHKMLVKVNEDFGESLEELGRSLLEAWSQPLREMVKAQEESPPKPKPPIPPRTRL